MRNAIISLISNSVLYLCFTEYEVTIGTRLNVYGARLKSETKKTIELRVSCLHHSSDVQNEVVAMVRITNVF